MPPFIPSVPIKSVSHQLQIALCLSSSNPFQRLHPLKRINTDFLGTDGINGGNYSLNEVIKIVCKLWPINNDEKPFVVCTGGEPLLQLDQFLVDEIHKNGFEIAIETNGTCLPPDKIDWICVSPKNNTKLIFSHVSIGVLWIKFEILLWADSISL